MDPECLNPELGTEEDFAAFTAALKQYDMGLLLDVVPNPRGSAPRRTGGGGTFSSMAGISLCDSVRHRLVAVEAQSSKIRCCCPFSGEQYGAVLENQDIRLVWDENGGFIVTYFQHGFLSRPNPGRDLSFGLEELTARVGEQDDHVQELLSILTAFTQSAGERA